MTRIMRPMLLVEYYLTEVGGKQDSSGLRASCRHVEHIAKLNPIELRLYKLYLGQAI